MIQIHILLTQYTQATSEQLYYGNNLYIFNYRRDYLFLNHKHTLHYRQPNKQKLGPIVYVILN